MFGIVVMVHFVVVIYGFVVYVILDIVDCWLLVAGMAVYGNNRNIFFLIENPENRPNIDKTDHCYHSIHRQNRPLNT